MAVNQSTLRSFLKEKINRLYSTHWVRLLRVNIESFLKTFFKVIFKDIFKVFKGLYILFLVH